MHWDEASPVVKCALDKDIIIISIKSMINS
jgi:hypothetical protein